MCLFLPSENSKFYEYCKMWKPAFTFSFSILLASTFCLPASWEHGKKHCDSQVPSTPTVANTTTLSTRSRESVCSYLHRENIRSFKKAREHSPCVSANHKPNIWLFLNIRKVSLLNRKKMLIGYDASNQTFKK